MANSNRCFEEKLISKIVQTHLVREIRGIVRSKFLTVPSIRVRIVRNTKIKGGSLGGDQMTLERAAEIVAALPRGGIENETRRIDLFVYFANTIPIKMEDPKVGCMFAELSGFMVAEFVEVI